LIEGRRVSPSPNHKPHEPPPSIRIDARLDQMTRAKVDDLATRFHRPRAAVLCHIMHWGISCRPMEKVEQGNAEGPVRHLSLYVASELYARVQKAATTAGVNIAPWLRQMVGHIPITDFPRSWQEERSERRSHDSRSYGARFMLRLDAASETTLQRLAEHFDVPRAASIRQLLAQATSEVFPGYWRLWAVEPCHRSRRPRAAQPCRARGRLEPSPQEACPCQPRSPSLNVSPPWRSMCG
jgi:predicted transcriptional regulator